MFANTLVDAGLSRDEASRNDDCCSPILVQRMDDVLKEQQLDRHFVRRFIWDVWYPCKEATLICLGI